MKFSFQYSYVYAKYNDYVLLLKWIAATIPASESVNITHGARPSDIDEIETVVDFILRLCQVDRDQRMISEQALLEK
nr:4511_t:CDS:2 [Entrophospora candida]